MKQILNYIHTYDFKRCISKNVALTDQKGHLSWVLKLERKTKSEIVTLTTQMVCPTMKKWIFKKLWLLCREGPIKKSTI